MYLFSIRNSIHNNKSMFPYPYLWIKLLKNHMNYLNDRFNFCTMNINCANCANKRLKENLTQTEDFYSVASIVSI